MQSPWAAFSPWEGTRGGSSILLFLTPCPEKGYLPKKTLQGTKKAKGIHDDTGDETSRWPRRKAGTHRGLLACSSARRNFAGWFRQSRSCCWEPGVWEVEKNSTRRWCFHLEKTIWIFWGASPSHTFLRRGLDYSAIDLPANAEIKSKPSTGMEQGAGISAVLHAGQASPRLWDGAALGALSEIRLQKPIEKATKPKYLGWESRRWMYSSRQAQRTGRKQWRESGADSSSETQAAELLLMSWPRVLKAAGC